MARELLKQPLAYQLRLLFMEFKVNVDKANERKVQKVNEVKSFIFIDSAVKENLYFRGESSHFSRGNSQMIGRLMGQEEAGKYQEISVRFYKIIRRIKAANRHEFFVDFLRCGDQ